MRERHLFYVILLARLLPVFSFGIISYGAGLTRISPRYFALATLLGMIPPTFLITYFGSGIFSGSGYAILLAGSLVLLFFLIPVWIKRKNSWGCIRGSCRHWKAARSGSEQKEGRSRD